MPYQRIYEEYEVRELLQRSEVNNSPRTGAAAHSRSLHAQTASTNASSAETQALLGNGASTTGTSMMELRRRVHTANNANQQSSAFLTLIHQASAATHALNSVQGQAALGWLDANPGAPRRVVLRVAGRPDESTFARNAVGISSTHIRRAIHNDRTSQVRTITSATTGVVMVLDSGAPHGGLHIQTCYPSNDPAIVSGFTPQP